MVRTASTPAAVADMIQLEGESCPESICDQSLKLSASTE